MNIIEGVRFHKLRDNYIIYLDINKENMNNIQDIYGFSIKGIRCDILSYNKDMGIGSVLITIKELPRIEFNSLTLDDFTLYCSMDIEYQFEEVLY